LGLPTFLPTFSQELGTAYLAPNSTPPRFKNLAKETPPGRHPPILVDGTHSSFLHIILLVRLAVFNSRALPVTIAA